MKKPWLPHLGGKPGLFAELITGDLTSALVPQGSATRAQIVTFLYRY